jgi:hypothetical protein
MSPCLIEVCICNRWHKAAGDAAKQAAKLQAEAKAAAAQCDAAIATAEEAKSLARRLDIKTGHLRRSASLVPGQVPHLTAPVLLYVLLVTALLCCVFMHSKTWRRTFQIFEKIISNKLKMREKNKFFAAQKNCCTTVLCELRLTALLCCVVCCTRD